MRKLWRKKAVSQNLRSEPPVMIVRPHKPDNWTCQPTSAFITRAILRGIAECQPLPSKLPELARNFSIHDFLAHYPNKTHIFFLDDDSPPCNEYAIERLLGLKKPAICGLTPIWRYDRNMKHFHLLWSAVITKEGHTEESPKLDNIGVDELPKKLFKAYRTGGTCLLVAREVLEKLEPPFQVTTFNKTVTDVEKSEDVYFADKIRAAGYDIWVDPETICHHFHTNMDILDVFSVYLQAKGEAKSA